MCTLTRPRAAAGKQLVTSGAVAAIRAHLRLCTQRMTQKHPVVERQLPLVVCDEGHVI